MGQLFNRLTNFAKTYINTTSDDLSYANGVLESEDDELKRIINELNSKKAEQRTEQKENKQNSQRSYTNPRTQQSPLQAEYNLLGVQPNVSDDILKQRYKQLVKENHPDVTGQNDKQSLEKMANINSAYTKIRKSRGI